MTSATGAGAGAARCQDATKLAGSRGEVGLIHFVVVEGLVRGRAIRFG